MITEEMKKQIVAAIEANRSKYASDARFAIALGINAAQFSSVRRGKLDRILSDTNWISIARRLDVQ